MWNTNNIQWAPHQGQPSLLWGSSSAVTSGRCWRCHLWWSCSASALHPAESTIVKRDKLQMDTGCSYILQKCVHIHTQSLSLSLSIYIQRGYTQTYTQLIKLIRSLVIKIKWLNILTLTEHQWTQQHLEGVIIKTMTSLVI